MRYERYEQEPCWELVARVKRRSMLHWETLTALWHLSKSEPGEVLEIGTYVGGATVVMADARKPRRITCIQPEAQHLVHPTLPTDDVLRDLRANLTEFNVFDYVDIIEKRSWEAVDDVAALLEDRRIGMLVIDADGMVGRDVDLFRPYLNEGAVLVLDDYGGFHKPMHAPDKQTLVRQWVHEQLGRNTVVTLGVLPWGTWFGRIA